MEVHATIVTVFAELFIFVMCWAAFALLAREYVSRRTPTLLAYCAGFAAFALAIATFFLAHVIAATGSEPTAVNAFRAAFAFASVSGFLICAAAARGLGAAVSRLITAAAAFATMTFVILLTSSPMTLQQANGMGFAVPSSSLLLGIFSPFLLYCLVRAWRSRQALVIADAQDVGFRTFSVNAHRLYFGAGVSGLIFVAAVTAAVHMDYAPLIVPGFIFLPISFVLTALAAATEGHSDTQVRKHPMSVISRSLLLKSAGFNALVLWAVTLAVTYAWFPQYLRSVDEERGAALTRDVIYFVQSYRNRTLSTMDEASREAVLPETVSLVSKPIGSDGDAHVLTEINSVSRESGIRLVRIVDADGIIRFGTTSNDQVGQPFPTSNVLAQALAGVRGSAWEKSFNYGVWATRTGVPVLNASGRVVGAVMVTEVDRSLVADSQMALSSYASGYGFVAPDGELGFSTGEPLEADDRPFMQEALAADGTVTVRRSDDETIYGASASSDGSRSSGYFYAFVFDSDANARAFIAVAKLAVLAYLIIGFMSALLFSAMGAVMRPLRALKTAAVKLGTGQSISRVKYESDDEVGQLAAAFNRTVDVVAKHTSELETAMRERQDFLDHAARELRTPLTVFRWTLESMRFGDTGSFTKEQLDLIEKLHQTNMRLEKMVDNLQDVSQVDRNRLRLDRHEMAIEDAVDVAAGEQAVTARIKDIDLRLSFPPHSLPKVHADPAYVQKILHNILGNAVKYTQPHGTITISAKTVDVSAPGGKPGAYVQVTIADSGIGIPSDERPRIFSRFFRAQNVAEFEIEGAGLGLYLAKRFVQMHGGDIELTSQEGVGTTVAFTLPVVEGAGTAKS